MVDGYEQLGRWTRARLVAFCRRCDCGLLATAHAPVNLPEIHRTGMDPDTIQRLVDGLQAGYPPHVAPADVAAGLARHGTNVRELLFELYDLYESRRRARRKSRLGTIPVVASRERDRPTPKGPSARIDSQPVSTSRGRHSGKYPSVGVAVPATSEYGVAPPLMQQSGAPGGFADYPDCSGPALSATGSVTRVPVVRVFCPKPRVGKPGALLALLSSGLGLFRFQCVES